MNTKTALLKLLVRARQAQAQANNVHQDSAQRAIQMGMEDAYYNSVSLVAGTVGFDLRQLCQEAGYVRGSS